MQDAGRDARRPGRWQELLDALPVSNVRQVAIDQRRSVIIYGSSLLVAVLWSILAPGAAQPVPRILERLVIVLLVALGGLGWALETRRLDSVVQRVRADVVVISDTGMIAKGRPSLCYGLRGLAYLQVDLQGPDSDLHSGAFGGAAAERLGDPPGRGVGLISMIRSLELLIYCAARQRGECSLVYPRGRAVVT